MSNTPATVNLADKFDLFDEYWKPKIIAGCNGQLVKIAKFKGEFVWHSHANEDELFLVVKGTVDMAFRTTSQEWTVRLGEGEMLVVPKGLEHKTAAESEAHVVMIEPSSTKHTGERQTDLTVELSAQEWI